MKHEESEHELLNRVIHSVDGIEEYDNKLPNWWLITLYGAVLFSAIYWFGYHARNLWDLPGAELAKWKDARPSTPEVEVSSEDMLAASKEPDTVGKGKEVFATNCRTCHNAGGAGTAPDGGGFIGPNLTDEFWLHGGAPDAIYKTISLGVPEKGMQAWAQQLGSDKTKAVAAYVVTLRGTNVSGGKEPQGEREPVAQP